MISIKRKRAAFLAVPAIIASMAFSSAPAPAPAAPPGYFLEEHATYGTCIAATGNVDADIVVLWSCALANNQEWKVQTSAFGTGQYVQFRNLTGACLADSFDSTASGEPAEMYGCGSNDPHAQEAMAWFRYNAFIGGIEYAFYRNANGRVCLGDFNNLNSNGNRIIVWACNNSYSEAWI